MKAILYRDYGPPEVLALQDIPMPAPKDDEVLVEVHASSVNDYDWGLLTGQPLINRAASPLRPKHLVLGSDIAGRVVAMGPAATRFRTGDEVFGDLSPYGFGAFAEYVSAPEAALALKPASLTFEQAAAVPQAASLAVTGLKGSQLLHPECRVLINGAGGGVGTFAVQIAKAFGAEVTGVDRAAKLDTVSAIGADHVIDYAEQDFTTNGQAYDLIVDVASRRSMADYRRSLKPAGACRIIGGSIPRILLVFALGPLTSAVRDTTVGIPVWKPDNPQDVAFLTRLLDARAVVPVVDRIFALREVPDAFRWFGIQAHVGKIVISI